jgi:dienelactone hydrolase
MRPLSAFFRSTRASLNGPGLKRRELKRTSLRYVALVMFAVTAVRSEAPATDSRNSITPDTNTHFHFEPPATLAAWEHRRDELRAQILTAAGLSPMPAKTALHPQIFGRIDGPGYTIEKVLLDTFPNYYLGGNLYRPTGPGRHPGILLAHGHWPYGRLEAQQLCNPQALAGTLAKAGLVVFMYDMVGYNDTIQTPHKFGGDSEQLWSFGPLGLQLWNSIRALDFISALPQVDADNVGMTGPSGGATQTLLLTAIEDRLKFTSPVNMISAYMQGGDTCENAPGLRIGTNNVEIGAMAAPRPMLVVSATGDWTKHVPQEEFPAIRKVYELYGKESDVSVVQIDAPHNLNEQSRNAVERFFSREILRRPDADSLTENGIPTEGLNEMLALFNRAAPAQALTYSELFASWRKRAEEQMNALTDVNELRQVLTRTLGVAWPGNVMRQQAGDGRIVLSRKGVGDRVPGFYQHHGKRGSLVLDAGGSEAAQEVIRQKKLASAGETVLAIDAFQTGAAVAPRDRSRPHFLTFNLTDDANRVQDVLTVLRFLNAEGCTSIDIYADAKSAWWAEFAAAVAPADVRITLHNPAGSLVDSEAAYLERFNVPGILRAGGLRTADRLLKARAGGGEQ